MEQQPASTGSETEWWSSHTNKDSAIASHPPPDWVKVTDGDGMEYIASHETASSAPSWIPVWWMCSKNYFRKTHRVHFPAPFLLPLHSSSTDHLFSLHQLRLFRIVGWCSYCVCVGRISKAPGIPAVILFRIPSVFRWSPPNRNFEQETTCCSQDYSQDVQYHFRYSFHSSSSFYYFYQIYAEPQWGKNKVLMEVITSCCLFLSTHAHLARSVSSSYSRYCQ